MGIIPLLITLLSVEGVLSQAQRRFGGPRRPDDPCGDAPSASARIICEQLRRWDEGARSKPPVPESAAFMPGTAGQPRTIAAELAPIEASPYQCMDLACLCTYIGGKVRANQVCVLSNGSILKKAIRKEYRMMTDDERQRYHAAIVQLKRSGEFDRMALIHAQFSISGGAHSGPAFLPWHREFMKRMEFTLRQIDPTLCLPYWDSTPDSRLPELEDPVLFYDEKTGTKGFVLTSGYETRPEDSFSIDLLNKPDFRIEILLRQIDPTLFLPYWDSTLDSRLPEPKDSVLWTEGLLGSTAPNGSVVTGDFADFVTFQNHPHITRKVGEQGLPFRDSDIDYVMAQTRIEKVLAFTAPHEGCPLKAEYDALEYTHGNVHIFVGGDMFDPYTSGNDPMFYMLHSFVDFIWEIYRKRKQSRYDRESVYPADNQLCSSALHFGSALMRPFEPKRNVDGLSNKYTDNMYEYAPGPSCKQGPTCGSKYLFCDRSHGSALCVSKVRIGGNCSGFINGEQVCYGGRCINGRCFKVKSQKLPVAHRPLSIPPTPAPILSMQSNCYNENECCAVWASSGECERNAAFMNEWCKVSCKKCRPNFNPALECADFHRLCHQWARNHECVKNRLWMYENCRRSCQRCGSTRKQVCAVDQKHTSVAPTPSTTATSRLSSLSSLMERCDSPGCFNEDICCPLWGLQGQCSVNATWMACNCKVSCGLCIPTEYDYGTCADYHPSCRQWSLKGECSRNPWMLENCRASCRSCMDQWTLRERCRIVTPPRWNHLRINNDVQQGFDNELN